MKSQQSDTENSRPDIKIRGAWSSVHPETSLTKTFWLQVYDRHRNIFMHLKLNSLKKKLGSDKPKGQNGQLAPAGRCCSCTTWQQNASTPIDAHLKVYRCKCNSCENSEVFWIYYLFIEASQISVLPHAVEDLRCCLHHLRWVSVGKHRRGNEYNT